MGVRMIECMHAHGKKIRLERESVDVISGAQELSTSQLRQGRKKREAKDDVKGPVCGS